MTGDGTGYSERLDTVRSKTGLDLRSFWRRLVDPHEDGTFGWSKDDDDESPRYIYRTAMRYHRGERTPEIDYLARVAEVFEVRIEWLVTGRGSWSKRLPRWLPHPGMRALEDRGFWDAMPLGSMSARMGFLELLSLYDIDEGRARRHSTGEGPGPLGKDFFGRADDLRFLLHLPLEAWGFGHARDVPSTYWRRLIDGLTAAVRELQSRKRYEDDRGGETRGEPLVDALRRAVEGP